MNKPNILLLFTDMQRFDTIAALGNDVIKTPNLDRLVKEGIAFTSAYSPCPVCIPARWCMHYGQYTTKSELAINGPMPKDNDRSIPAILGEAGYKTASIGKCHFTPDRHAKRGFGSRLIQEECCSKPDNDDYCRWLADNNYDYDEPQGTRGEMYYTPQVSLHCEKSHPTNWIGDRSIEFIRNNSGGQQSWFLMSSFIHPHPPFAPPKPWHKLYRGPDMPLPNVPEDSESLYTWINRFQNRYKYRDRGIDVNMVRMMKAYYYATISFVDFQIGRILEELEKTGQLDNTLIVFSSDHGEFLGDYNCFGKRSMHDPASRIPMVILGCGFEGGQVCNRPVSLVDLMPTFLRAAGIGLDDIETDGVDLAGIVDGSLEREYVFSQFGSNEMAIYMIVNERWKYFYSCADQLEVLFDRERDPGETKNLASDESFAVVKDKMKQALLSFLKKEKVIGTYREKQQVLEWTECSEVDLSPYMSLYKSRANSLKDMSDDPDAGLIFQDHDAYTLDRPGYTSPQEEQ